MATRAIIKTGTSYTPSARKKYFNTTMRLTSEVALSLSFSALPNNFFFFSSRRRHTRLTGDWSSDVCSSDLRLRLRDDPVPGAGAAGAGRHLAARADLFP